MIETTAREKICWNYQMFIFSKVDLKQVKMYKTCLSEMHIYFLLVIINWLKNRKKSSIVFCCRNPFRSFSFLVANARTLSFTSVSVNIPNIGRVSSPNIILTLLRDSTFKMSTSAKRTLLFWWSSSTSLKVSETPKPQKIMFYSPPQNHNSDWTNRRNHW